MDRKKNSILIVDDENVNIKVLARILGSEYIIYTASSGMDAIESAKVHKPDLILLDILMPDMDGYQTLSLLKKTEEIYKIPVIFITGLDSDEDEVKGLSLDAVDYITKPFSSTVVKLRVRNQIQIITQMRMIEELSYMDQLTGLSNRRSFDERLKMEWKQAIREKTNISLLMMDLDKFKNINDIYGHMHGDLVLQTVAGIIKQVYRRPGDFAARWGGEEFVILLPNTSVEGAVEIAEKLRTRVENTEITHENGEITKITISVGVRAVVPDNGITVDTFVSEADKALYAAKAAGRNKVICYNGLL
ncbi:MAG: diguanylate cyclase [Treponema sp.]|nr:diguanylate cyclase [Treponema sp.]